MYKVLFVVVCLGFSKFRQSLIAQPTLGFSNFERAFQTLKCKNFDCQHILLVSQVSLPSTQSPCYMIKSNSSFTLEPNSEYKIRAQIVYKNKSVSDWSDDLSQKTLPRSEIFRMLSNPSERKKTIEELVAYLCQEMTEEGKLLGIEKFRFLVFGDIGAGKSAFLNTLATALSSLTGKEFKLLCTIGVGNEKSTTKKLFPADLAKTIIGTDVPGICVNNYEKGKIHALLESRIKELTDLDDANWTQHLRPFDIRKMIHVVFFIIPVDSCDNSEVCARYSQMYKLFADYKDYGLGMFYNVE